MTQKLLIGGLSVAIIAVIGFGLIDASHGTEDTDDAAAISKASPVTSAPWPGVPVVTPEPTQEPAPVQTDTEATVDRQLVVKAQDTMGDPWQAEGTVTQLEDFGFTLATSDGEFYVELGPPTYWQAQGIPLAEGDLVRADGYFNGEQVHARVVNVNGAELVIRNEDGQPMWASGVSNGNGSGQNTNEGSASLQVAPEDWLTLVGQIASVSQGNVTLAVDDGTVINLQLGRPDFWQRQGITLNAGDPVEVLGFWSGNQFMAGDIRKTETGETIMLRDPNGRQLWAGPGRNGQGQAGQNGRQGNEAGGQGNGYRGGQEG